MRLFFWLVLFFLACVLLWYLPVCSLPPRGDDPRDHMAYARELTVGGAVVGGLVLVLVIGWLGMRRELPK